MSSLRIHTGQVPITHDVGLYECTKIMAHTYLSLHSVSQLPALSWTGFIRVIGTFLVVQWLALYLSMQWVWA